MNDTDELLPCPFCGAKPKLFHGDRKIVGHGESSDKIGVRCFCGASILVEDYAVHEIEKRKKIAIQKWNIRYEPSRS